MGGDPLTWWRRFAFESGSCYSDDAPTSYSPSPMEFNLSLNPHSNVDSTVVSRLLLRSSFYRTASERVTRDFVQTATAVDAFCVEII